jgi:SagB-type dehydrogenase family enzyme
MIIDAADPTGLSRLYHLNSRPWGSDAREFGADSPFRRLPASHPGVISLAGLGPASKVATLAARRRCCRRYAARAMPLATAASLLNACYGVTALRYETPTWARWARVVPSAGGLYPLDIHVVARGVESVPDGVYRFEPADDQLQPRPDRRLEQIEAAIFNPEFIVNANMLVLIAAHFPTTQKKYGPRGYRYILIEAGHVAQTLGLAATELGCAHLCMGGFDDDGLNRALGLHPLDEGVIYCLAVGFAAED